eukprot:EG_transcript_3154
MVAAKPKAESSDEELVKRKVKVKQASQPSPKKATAKGKSAPPPPPPPDKKEPRRKAKPEPEPEEVYKWWEKKEQHPDGQHWLTLEHNGVLFPPEYVPHGRPVMYRMDDGTEKVIKLDPDEEEVATMFAVMREQIRPPSDYYINPTFRKNFFTDWLEILNSDPARNIRRFGQREHIIKVLDRVNFDAIWEWHVQQKEIKKNMTREQKAELKKAKDEAEKANKYCIWDGKKQPVGNFRIEPPGLFRGRGKHPLMGKLKKRVYPEDVIINIGEGAKVPEAPPGHHWKEVRHDNKVTWLANWTENVCGNGKYVMLAASSMVKGKSDYKKFEKARNLGEIIDVIRQNYRKAWASNDLREQQRGVALYFIDFLALRCGHEKGEDEAETFGACSLKCEHISLDKENHVLFDFLGKDSIRYYNEVQVDPKVYQLLRKFVKGKTPNSDLFDRVQPTQLNTHLKELMPGLSAKVFRTYNASFTLDREFHDFPTRTDASLPEKIVEFNAANTKVALLCNHQRSVGKGHEKTMAQFSEKLEHVKKLLERLLAAKELMQKDKKHGAEKARERWEADEHEQQTAWLEQYGTPEEQQQYQEKRAGKAPASPKKKSNKKRKASPSPAKKAKKAKVKIEDDSDSDSPAPKTKAKSKVKDESDDDSDVPLSKKSKKVAKKPKVESSSDSDEPAPKAKAKAAKKPAYESDSDSDAPLTAKKKSTPKKASAKASVPTAKASPKKASGQKKKDLSSDDELDGKVAKNKKKAK